MISAVNSTQTKQVQDAAQEFKITDQVLVIIFGEHDTVIITQSELKRPNLDGSMRSLDDIVFECLIYLDANKFGMTANPETADRYLKVLQRENNLTQDQLKTIFENAGYTWDEARMQLARLSIINETLDFRIRSRLVVPEKEVIKYYDEHPKLEPTSFLLERVFVPYPVGKKINMDLYKKSLPESLAKGALDDRFPRTEFWVKEIDLAEDKAFIAHLQEGEVSPALVTEGGFELFRIKEKRDEHVIPLEDRRLEIIEQLRRPRYEKLFAEYRAKLFESATIVYCQQEKNK